MSQLLLQKLMEKRVETLAALAKMVMEKGRSFLGNIINMVESAVSLLHQEEGPSKPNEAGGPRFLSKKGMVYNN
jgi:hypothetical protein